MKAKLITVSGVVVTLALAMAFTWLNSSYRVTLRLGFTTIYGVPLTAVVFGGLLVGMLVMLVAGVRSDLKVRRILRARLMEEDRAERGFFVDLDQQDLFEEGKRKG